MGLDQFLHFRLAIMEKKVCGVGGGWARTFRVVTSLTFLQWFVCRCQEPLKFMPFEPEIIRDVAKNLCQDIYCTLFKYNKKLGTAILVET